MASKTFSNTYQRNLAEILKTPEECGFTISENKKFKGWSLSKNGEIVENPYIFTNDSTKLYMVLSNAIILKDINGKKFKFSVDETTKDMNYCSDGSGSIKPYSVYPYNLCSELVDTSNLIEVDDLEGELSSIVDCCFASCKNLSSVNCNNVLSIGNSAFERCENLRTINCISSQSIDIAGFNGCKNLISIDIPNVESIGLAAFTNCYGLTSINCPNLKYLTKPNWYVWGGVHFAYCYNLSSLYLPNIVSIASRAFAGCENLSSIYCINQDTPPYLEAADSFDMMPSNFTIWVKNEAYRSYLTANNWSQITSHISSVVQPTVSFLSDDTYESLISEQKLNYGMGAIPPIVVKPYYDFKGWNGNYNDVSSDTSCFAIFSKRFITSDNTFLDMSTHNMSGNDADFIHTCDEINPKVTYTNEEGEESILENTRDYSITYYNNVLTAENLNYGQTVSKTAIVEISGNGYYEGKLSTEFLISYTRNISAVSITLNPCGGDIEGHSESQTIIRNTGDKYYPLPNAIKVGSTFGGWLLEDVGIIDKNSIVDTYSAHTLSAQWTIDTYTLTYQCPHMISTDNPSTYIMGDSVIFNVPEMEKGYTFNGWSPDKITAEDYSDKTVIGTSSPTQYSITYILNGGTTDNPTSYTIEDSVITLNNASKTGHTFIEWQDEDGITVIQIDTQLCKNRTITAIFKLNELNMYYHTNWGENKNLIMRGASGNDYKFDALSSNINGNLQYCSVGSNVPIKPYSDITELNSKGNLIDVNDINRDISSIGNFSFYKCSNLSSVNCNNVLSIGYSTFHDCRNLLSIKCDGVLSIDNTVFRNCAILSSINIPNATTIKHVAFEYCQSISSINCPNVEFIGCGAFSYCQNLSTLSVAESNPNFSFITDNNSDLTSKNGIVLIDNNEHNVIWGSVPMCENIILPNDVSSIGDSAFSGCKNLNSINISNTKLISRYSFIGCSELTTIILSDVTEVPIVFSDSFDNSYKFVYLSNDIMVNKFREDSVWGNRKRFILKAVN